MTDKSDALVKALKASDRDYLLALGEFIDQFARTEAMLHYVLRHFAKTSQNIGNAVFSGVRVDAAVSFIRRIAEVEDPGETARKQIDFLFTHLAEINNLRNDIVHYGSEIRGGGRRVTTNRIMALTADRIRERAVSPEILRDAASDLNKINIHLSAHLLIHMPNQIMEGFRPILDASWRYKPHAQGSNHRKSRDKPPKQ